MKITFLGATREVTGSCYLVETGKVRILVDCGMFQGTQFAETKNEQEFGFDPGTIDAVIVTHAHLDHTGRLPKLVRDGYHGPVYLTPPTAELALVVLDDAVQVIADEAERTNRARLYEKQDVARVKDFLKPIDYSRKVTFGDLTFWFRDAGHILGSAFVEIEEAGGARAAFSGDLGNVNDPILKPTAQLSATDILVMESTYGNRIHEEAGTRLQKLQMVIESTMKQKGVLLIPAFAIERTQLLLFELNHLSEHKLIPDVDIYLDSPMAIRTSEVFQRFPQYYNQDALRQVERGDDLFSFPGLHKTITVEQSKTINEAPWPKVIVAGAGMMNAGRILHHLVRYLGDERCTVLIVGYQSAGTLGRKLYMGEKHVEVLNERINVRARIASIGAYSAHADQVQLLHWLETAEKLPGHVYCTHGEPEASAALATRITQHFKIPADVPRLGQQITT